MKSPPLGLMPEFMVDPFESPEIRLLEIKRAMVRYLDADYKIPLAWILEYNSLIPKTLTIELC